MLSAAYIKQCAQQIGFAACGMAPAHKVSPERAQILQNWLQKGWHGDMLYLSNHTDKRLNPQLLVEGAQTVVCLAVNYSPTYGNQNPIENDETGKNTWKLARYAYGTDYHEVVKQMLRQLMCMLNLQEGVDGRCFVDTAPIDEKYWAQQSGIGWQGRNSQIIIPQAGSYFFLGELILTHPVDHYDKPQPNRCGNCRACIDACPTHALKENGEIDARRCLSYLTIEYHGELTKDLGNQMQNCFYGCDRCAEACPWNKRFASPTSIKELKPRQAILDMTPNDWLNLNIEKYRELFRKSAVKRAKFEGLIRNIQLIAQHKSSPNDTNTETGTP